MLSGGLRDIPDNPCDLCGAPVPAGQRTGRVGRPGVYMCPDCALNDPIEVLAGIEGIVRHEYVPEGLKQQESRL